MLDDRVLRLGQNLDQRAAIQIFQHRAHRHTADEFRNEAKLDQVDRLHLGEQIDIAPPAQRGMIGRPRHVLLLFLKEAHALLAAPARNHLFQAHECATADEQNIGGIDRREFLVRMFTAALRRNVRYRTFQDLQESLLYAFARDVPRNRRVFVFAADFIDFVDVDDSRLASLNVAVGRLQAASG